MYIYAYFYFIVGDTIVNYMRSIYSASKLIIYGFFFNIMWSDIHFPPPPFIMLLSSSDSR